MMILDFTDNIPWTKITELYWLYNFTVSGTGELYQVFVFTFQGLFYDSRKSLRLAYNTQSLRAPQELSLISRDFTGILKVQLGYRWVFEEKKYINYLDISLAHKLIGTIPPLSLELPLSF